MNITLIGMPGSGKSYIGEKLAQSPGYTLLELDRVTEQRHQKPLQAVLDQIGEVAFLTEQAHDAIVETTGRVNLVISSGGSIIYSPEAMQHLKAVSKIIYLKTSIETITQRIKEIPRGIVGLHHKTFEELYIERTALYEQYADYIIDADQLSEVIIADIKNAVASI
jgi:shikimate kinase